VAGDFNSFRTSEAAYPRQVTLKPFYRTHDRRYTIFWDTYTEEDWKEREAEIAREQELRRDLERRTIDLCHPGEIEPGQEHGLAEASTWIEEFRSRKARTADRGGWFSCEMEADPADPWSLSVEYWGGYTGSRTFDILVEGRQIATENISQIAPGRFIDRSYAVPQDLVRGMEKVEIRFVPHEGHRAGPVFTVRTVRD